MNQWTPQNIAALITAIAGAIGAAGAIFHSINTRKQVTNVNNNSTNTTPANATTPPPNKTT